MVERPPALAQQDLTGLAHDPTFRMRVGLLYGQMYANQTEGIFGIHKYATGGMHFTTVYMPETPEENDGYDPAHEISLGALFPAGVPSTSAVSHIHSHPSSVRLHEYLWRLPSPTDLHSFATYSYPVNPGFIGGIVLGGMPGPDLLLYRARERHFDPERTANPDLYTGLDFESRLRVLDQAGIALAHLLFLSDGSVMGLNQLQTLYE